MSSLGQLLTGLGGLIVGIAAIVSLIIAVRARKDAAEARRVSPPAVLEGLRKQVSAVVDAHEDAMRRYQLERDGLEKALRRERERADGAELLAFQFQASATEMRIDLAATRAEVADLRNRFEASIATEQLAAHR